LTLKVTKAEHTSLTFRFSTAIQGAWSHESENKDNLLGMIQDRSTLSGYPKYRIYLAIRGQKNRQFLLEFFNPKNFDLNTALQLKNLVSEPSYYTPDMIILDEFLCLPPHQERFEKMLSLIGDKTPVLIVGGQQDSESFKEKYPSKTFVCLEELSSDGLRGVVSRFLTPGRRLPQGDDERVLYFEKDDPLSCVSGVVQGRLSSVHPFVARVGSPVPFKNFSLCRVDSPFLTRWLGKQVWLKLTETGNAAPSQDKKMIAGGAGILADVSLQDKSQLARGLSLFITKVLRTGASGAGQGSRTPDLPKFHDEPVAPEPSILQPQGGEDSIMGTTRYYDEQDTPQSVPPDIKIENSQHDPDLVDPVAPLSGGKKGFSSSAPGPDWAEPGFLDQLLSALSSRGVRYFLTLILVGMCLFS